VNDNGSPGEFELIDRIREILPDPPEELAIGPGDDCAGVRIPGGRLFLMTCDSLVEGRHFSRNFLGPYDLGRRLAAVNLSDIAAMGGRPLYALASLALSPDEAAAWTGEMARGMTGELSRFGAHLVGGNLSSTPAGVMADMTLLGEVEEDRVLLRSGARSGDAVMVTGHLGSSTAGRRLLAGRARWREGFDALARAHVLPEPRIREGLVLARSGTCTSAIDISDGLASDLAHVCKASGVGAEIRIASIPALRATLEAASALDVPPEDLILSGGEDYELLFTAPEDRADELAVSVEEETGTPVSRIGAVTAAGGIRYLDDNGVEAPPPGTGWDHFQR
jgi:thiamine-monophosphate kinase